MAVSSQNHHDERHRGHRNPVPQKQAKLGERNAHDPAERHEEQIHNDLFPRPLKRGRTPIPECRQAMCYVQASYQSQSLFPVTLFVRLC